MEETIIPKDGHTFDTILHISDLHIRLSSRFKEYSIVFQSFVHLLKRYDHAIVVITGDVFHTKNELTPDCVMICVQFLRNVSKHAPVVIIPGNHDLVMHNLDKCDTITSVLHRRALKNVHYLKASGVYRFGNLVFVHNSLWRPKETETDPQEWIPTPPRVHKDDVRIHLYHGMVGRCQTANGIQFHDTLSLSKFHGADMVLLGDIHKHQCLAPHIAYAGSMISQNFNETDDQHGFIEWNVASKTPTFHALFNPYAFRQIDVYDHGQRLVFLGNVYNDWKRLLETEEISPKMRVQILIHDDVDIQTVRNMCRAYGIMQPRIRHVVASPTPLILSTDDSDGAQGIQHTVSTYLVQYMKDVLGITNEDDLQTYASILRENVDMLQTPSHSIGSKNGQRWRILDLSFDYLFGYGKDNLVQFEDTTSQIIGIFGSNSVGKSTLIDILLFMLYGRITRYASGNSIPKELIHESQLSFQATLRIQVGTDVYTIHKHGKRDKNLRIRIHEKITLKDGDREVDLTEEHRIKTDKVIREMIGSMEQFLSLSVCLQSGTTKSFKDMTQKERKEFMYAVLHLDGFEAYRQRLHQEMKELDAQHRVLALEQSRAPCTTLEDWKVLVDTHRSALSSAQSSKNDIEKKMNRVEKQCRAHDRVRSQLAETETLYHTEKERHDRLLAKLPPSHTKSPIPDNDDHRTMEDIAKELESVESQIKELDASPSRSLESCPPVPSGCPSFSLRHHLRLAQQFKDKPPTTISRIGLPSITTLDDDRFVFVFFRTKFIEFKALELREMVDREGPIITSAKERMVNYEKRVTTLQTKMRVLETEYETHQQATYDPEGCAHCKTNPFRHRQVSLDQQIQKLRHEITVLQQQYDYEYRQVERRIDGINKTIEYLYAWDTTRLDEYDDIEAIMTSSPATVKYPLGSDTFVLSLHTIINDLNRRLQTKDTFCEAMDAFCRRHLQTYQEKCRSMYHDQVAFLQALDKYVLISHRNRRRSWEISQRAHQRSQLLQRSQDLRQHQQRMMSSLLSDQLEQSKSSLTALEQKIKTLQTEVRESMGAGSVEDVRRELSRMMAEEVACEHRLQETEHGMMEWKQRAEECASLQHQRTQTKTLLQLTDRDGFPLYLLRRLMDGLSTYMNEILQHFLDRRIAFGIDDEGNVLFHTLSEDSNMTFHFYGGMESLMIDLATKITFAHFGLCPMSTFFILDENISVMDEFHIQHIHVLFEFLKQHFDTVWMISHIPTIKNMVDRAVVIQKDHDGYSHIRMESCVYAH